MITRIYKFSESISTQPASNSFINRGTIFILEFHLTVAFHLYCKECRGQYLPSTLRITPMSRPISFHTRTPGFMRVSISSQKEISSKGVLCGGGGINYLEWCNISSSVVKKTLLSGYSKRTVSRRGSVCSLILMTTP